MDHIASQTIAIFKRRAERALDLGPDTRLADLDIGSLDLAVIVLDTEDAFGVDFAYDPAEADAFPTVGAFVEWVRVLVEAKRRRLLASLAPDLARPKSLWITAGWRA